MSMSIKEQHQPMKVDGANKINFVKCWLKQPNFSEKWHISKSLPTDVETGYLNDYIDYLIRTLNNYRNFNQIFNCDFSYLNRLSKVKLQYFDCGSLTKSTQDCLPHLTVLQPSNSKRNKINFGGTENVLQHFPTDIMEIILTGNRFSRNECYKVAS